MKIYIQRIQLNYKIKKNTVLKNDIFDNLLKADNYC